LQFFKALLYLLQVHSEDDDISDHSLFAEEYNVLQVAIEMLFDLLISEVEVSTFEDGLVVVAFFKLLDELVL